MGQIRPTDLLLVGALALCPYAGGVDPPRAQISVRLQPRAGRDELRGERDGVLIARVTAPPVDGRANAALCRLVARAAGVAPSRVSIVRGETARHKVLRVEGVDEAALRAALGLSPGSP